MFEHVLIVEDQQSIIKGLQLILHEFRITRIDTATYCDDAFTKLKVGLSKHNPFDLLITDLSFIEDHRGGKIRTGKDLIQEARELQPDLPIIVFSIEHRVGVVKDLIHNYAINAYILKGRRESTDIRKAIQALQEKRSYYSQEIFELLRNSSNISEVDSSDKLILDLLAKGLHQKQISEHFKRNGISSSSKRSIEYRIQNLKTLFEAETLPHLISIAKDIGLI